MKTVFVAGATGAVGSVLVPYLRDSHFAVIPHVRPKTAEDHPLGKDHRALIADLSDTARLDEQMARAHAVVCLVGTTRRRFAAGDTYDSSDYRPVVQLLESARRAPLPVDVLCLAIARIIRERAPFGILKGRQLWDLGLNPAARMAAER